MKSRCAATFLAAFFSLPVLFHAQLREHRDLRSSLYGRVLSAGEDRAVPGARVRLRLLAGGWSDETLTDGNGEFTFLGLSTGHYVVNVSWPGSPDLEEAVQVETANAPLVFRLSGPGATARERGMVVSVRELSIPGKARKAFEKGLRRLQKKDAAGSLVEFERAISAFPSYYEAYFKLGIAQLDLDRGIEAAQAFRKSIELSKGRYAVAYFALGFLLCHGNNFAAAEHLIQSGLSLDPASIAGQYSLAWAELGLNRLAEAEKAVREVLRHKTSFAEARLLLAEIHRRQKNFPALVADLDIYLKLDSDSPRSAQLRILRDKLQQALTRRDEPVVASAKP